jgi:deoxycytidylate deaminase
MLPRLENPELVFSLCSPIGTENKKVSALLTAALCSYGYKTTIFKVTDLMKGIVIPDLELPSTPTEKRYDAYIKYANTLRELYKDNSVLAMLCCAAIRQERAKSTGKPNSFVTQHAYIFDQFKRREEIDALRQVYGRLFVAVSIYSDRDQRILRLSNQIAQDHADARLNSQNATAEKLIEQDENEPLLEYGQRLREAFPTADLFIDIDDEEHAKRQIDRFLKGLFGSNGVGPTIDENGMYLAKSAALRSLDLSRQVGAAIVAPTGEVISLGYNEVPKPHGGVYCDDDESDRRDFKLGNDPNDRIKRALLADVLKRLRDGKYLEAKADDSELVSYVLSETMKRGSLLREALVMDILEFGRVIHAEMCALMDAARKGLKVEGATLYCTTFPCHLCAKHIIAAGIGKVIFIEPYPKSFAQELHESIEIKRGKSTSMGKIQFAPFIGVSPQRFKHIYERGKRKNEKGEYLEWMHKKPTPNVDYTVATYLVNEEALSKLYSDATKMLIEQKKLKTI